MAEEEHPLLKLKQQLHTQIHDFDESEDKSTHQLHSDSRTVRSQYIALQRTICEGKDDIGSLESDKFNIFINQVQELHQHVNKPREQVADAEALLELTESLHACVKSHAVSGISTSEFMYCLLKEFKLVGGQAQKRRHAESSIDWKKLGLFVSPVFKDGKGCNTILGPMSNELKQRKIYARRQRTRIARIAKPEELDDAGEKDTDTDKNIITMFEILKKKKIVKLEYLVLNRESFAQTVENLFSLSFLVKDGRVIIDVDDEGSHFVSPTNAPDSKRILAGEDRYDHFVFRFDFSDWKMMMDMVPEGKELMPHRGVLVESCYTPATTDNSSVRNMPRNHGLPKPEKSNFTDSGEVKMNDASSGYQESKLL